MVRVFIVEDHDVVRQSLEAVLSREHDFEVTGSMRTAEAALLALDGAPVDVVVVDYLLPGMNAAAFCRLVRERARSPAVVVHSGYLHDDVVRRCLAAGARACVLKGEDIANLAEAIRAASRSSFTSEIAPGLSEALVSGKPGAVQRRF